MIKAAVYYRDFNGREPVRQYIESVEQAGQSAEAATILRTVEALEERGLDLLRTGHARLIDQEWRLYELRPGRPGPHRIAFWEGEDVWVLLYAWRKQSQKLDQRAARRAINNLDDWQSRSQGAM